MSKSQNIQITTEMIDNFLQFLAGKGRKEVTINSYQSVLYQWYKSLPEGKILTTDALERWKEELKKKSVAETYVASRMSMLKNFLTYLEDPDLIRERGRYKKKDNQTKESFLTRQEYLLMLHIAKIMGRKRTYLLVKTMVCLGLWSAEIQNLTMDVLKKDRVELTYRGNSRTVLIYEPLKNELLKYAAEQGIEEGPVFVTQDGQPMQHYLIWKDIKYLCRKVGLSEDKGVPSNLYKLFFDTQQQMDTKSVEGKREEYRALLQREEAIIGWK